MLIPVAGLLLVLIWSFVASHLPPAAPTTPKSKKRVERAAAVVPKSPPAKTHRGDIVLILDDVGFDHQPLAEAMAIDPNLNFAVLPNARNAAVFADQLDAHGFEVLCHLPMEPEGFPRVSPGAKAVLTSMSDGEISETTRADIAAVPHARGVNNHMGSRATADRRVMQRVLGALPKGMYFIDSRTTNATVAATLAHSMNVKTASRNVFLDDVPNDDAIRAQLRALSQAASEHGAAVGIGHMYPSTIRVLGAAAPQLRADGFRFIRASEIVE
jgi:polysaccharide deacetylase 2 family uncharacterized protein YibQ